MAASFQKITEQEDGATLHPVEQRMAKHWIKARLVIVFPELRNNPHATEKAYHALSLEAREGTLPEDAGTIYEISHH